MKNALPDGHSRSRALKDWKYSLLFIPLYVGLFLFWQWMPSRTSFVLGSLVVAGAMSWLILRGRREGYFAGRVDGFLHIYVVLDVLLEGFVFELLLLGDRFGLLTTAEANQARSLVNSFHDNQHFIGCTAFFVVAIGANRFFALRRRHRASLSQAVEPENSRAATPTETADEATLPPNHNTERKGAPLVHSSASSVSETKDE